MEGRIEGRMEGRMEGRAEGRMEGHAEGLMEGKIEIARNLKLKGLDIGTIHEVTGLSSEDILKL